MSYTEQDLKNQLKPYSENGFVAFFQKISRGWLSAWYGFAEKHPTLANLIYMVFFFVVFSMGVTIWQYVVMTFLPYALTSLGTEPWGWPNIPIEAAGGRGYMIFGDEAGFGTWLAFEIAVFTAQCINFPLQRNITYRSHGNPWYQAMWYFIGWVLVSIFVNALWGICNIFLLEWGWPRAITGLLQTFITGGVSMIIFFFIFLIIFPDNNKLARKTKAKYEKLKASNASQKKLEKAEKAYKTAQDRADRSNSEKEYHQASTQLNSKVLKYFAVVKDVASAEEQTKVAYQALEEGTSKGVDVKSHAKLVDAYASAQKNEADLKAKVEEFFTNACEAIDIKEEKLATYTAVMDRLGLPIK